MSGVMWVMRDPLGRHIRLYDSDWYNHILAEHRDLRGLEQAVAAVLRTPARIMRDADREHHECLYGPHGRRTAADRYLKVCVAWVTESVGEVVTAFLTPRIHREEVQRWPLR